MTEPTLDMLSRTHQVIVFKRCFPVSNIKADGVADTSPEKADRAKQFFDRVKNTWDEKGDDIHVWDFFALETDGGNLTGTWRADGWTTSSPSAVCSCRSAPRRAQCR
jgi:hypothetical protein